MRDNNFNRNRYFIDVKYKKYMDFCEKNKVENLHDDESIAMWSIGYAAILYKKHITICANPDEFMSRVMVVIATVMRRYNKGVAKYITYLHKAVLSCLKNESNHGMWMAYKVDISDFSDVRDTTRSTREDSCRYRKLVPHELIDNSANDIHDRIDWDIVISRLSSDSAAVLTDIRNGHYIGYAVRNTRNPWDSLKDIRCPVKRYFTEEKEN